MSAHSYKALEDLTEALNKTNWSSWQTTAAFQKQLEAAERVIRVEKLRDSAVELLDALKGMVSIFSTTETCEEYLNAIEAIQKAEGGQA